MYTYKIFDSITKEFEDIFNIKDVKYNSTFFQHIEYIREITKHNKRNLKIVIIYYNNRILTILPFEIKNIFYKKFFNGLEQNIQIIVILFYREIYNQIFIKNIFLILGA